MVFKWNMIFRGWKIVKGGGGGGNQSFFDPSQVNKSFFFFLSKFVIARSREARDKVNRYPHIRTTRRSTTKSIISRQQINSRIIIVAARFTRRPPLLRSGLLVYLIRHKHSQRQKRRSQAGGRGGGFACKFVLRIGGWKFRPKPSPPLITRKRIRGPQRLFHPPKSTSPAGEFNVIPTRKPRVE